MLRAAQGTLPPDAVAEVYGLRSSQSCERAGEALRTPPLFPGRYVAFVRGKSFAPTAVAFTVGEGAEITVPVTLPTGAPQPFELVGSTPLPEGSVEVILSLHAHGEVGMVVRGECPTSAVAGAARRRRFELTLAPGKYLLFVDSKDRPRARAQFEVGTGEREVVRVTVE
jgi:hypothetical protein